jgi:hypothetical protein
MSRLDDLPPDQKAALSLLLRRRQSYADLAAVLDISERAVHDRAHAGLATLAPAQARALSAEERERIGDFLLGQQHGDDERAGTLLVLASSPDARAWAQALVAELAPIGDGALPTIPTDDDTAAAPARAPSAPPTSTPQAAPAEAAAPARTGGRPQLPVSRTAGAILLAVLVAGVVLAVLLIPSGGSSPKPAAASKAPASRGEAASTSGTTPTQDKRIVMRPVEAGSKAIGVALVLSEGSKYAFYLAAEHMQPSSGFFYAVWLYNSPTSAEALGKSPAVGADGRLQGGALLPADAASFGHLLVTRETNEHPSHPGTIVLSGSFSLH